MLTKERKKQLDIDLGIISITSVLSLGICMVFNSKINEIAYDPDRNIVLRVLLTGGLFQFGIAGLGISVVSIMRKESFFAYGLHSKKLVLTLALSALCCVPDYI